MIKTFKNSNGLTVAYFFSLDTFKGNVFPTSADQPMQFGFSDNLVSRSIPKHIHKNIDRNISVTSEFIYVIKGKMKIKIFDEKGLYLSEIELSDNDALLQFIGGHSFEIDKGTRFFEIKQGPYLGQNADKYYEDTSK